MSDVDETIEKLQDRDLFNTTEDCSFGSKRKADIALCSMIANYIGKDVDKIDKVLQESGRMRDELEDDDYRKGHIIKKAIERKEIVESEEDAFKELANMSPPETRRLSGIYNDTFFITTWFYHKPSDSYRKFVLTSDMEIKQVYKNDEHDYEYFEIDGDEVRFEHKIPDRPQRNVNHPTNDIINYIQGEKEIESKEELYEKVKMTIIKHYDHHNPAVYDIATAYIFHSYLMMIFGFTYYIYLVGKENTGKTQLQKTLALMQYNGQYTGNATAKATIRHAHNYQGALHMEEIDKMGGENKKSLQGLLNTGNRKGATYSIANTDFTDILNQTQDIHTFSPKTISANDSKDLTDSFESRSIPIQAVRTQREVDNPDKVEEKPELNDFMKDLRNQITVHCLKNWKEIRDIWESEKKRVPEKGREAEKITMFTAIVKYFKPDKVESTEKFIRDSLKLSSFGEPSQREGAVLKYLIHYFNQRVQTSKEETYTIEQKQIAEKCNNKLGVDESNQYSMTSRSVGRKLKKYGIIRDPDKDKVKSSNARTAIKVNYKTIEDTVERYALDRIFDIELLPHNKSTDNYIVEKEDEEDVSKLSEKTTQLPEYIDTNKSDEDNIETVYE